MKLKPTEARLRELQSKNLPRAEVLKTLYLERHPIFEVTRALRMSSSELQEMNEGLRLFSLRCPCGHRFSDHYALHAKDAHYCTECQRWFNEATLRDEIELEIKRLKFLEKKPIRY